MHLKHYNKGDYHPGAAWWKQFTWFFLGSVLLRSKIFPFSSCRALLLRLFGAQIGRGVVLKPGLQVKYPWKLKIGDHSWIGEDVWIDNLGEVHIGTSVCVSQGAYLCTGNHDWSSPTFSLRVQPIYIHDHAWVAARACLAPGVILHEGAVACLGSVVTGQLDTWGIYAGNPARRIATRSLGHPKS